MFKIERMQRIKEIMREYRQIEVSALSSLLDVSDTTIRTDLEELEKEGFLVRFHGGATITSPEPEKPDGSAMDSFVKYDKNKEEIGMIAAQLIREREWIFLGPGTTTFFIAKALRQKSNINVLTNSFLVANILRNSAGIKTIFLGGEIDRQGFYTIPDHPEKEFNNTYLDKAFFSVDGVDLLAGYTLSDISVLETIRFVKKQSKQTIMAVDRTKFNQRAFRRVCDIDDIGILITNADLPDNYRDFFRTHGICVHDSLC